MFTVIYSFSTFSVIQELSSTNAFPIIGAYQCYIFSNKHFAINTNFLFLISPCSSDHSYYFEYFLSFKLHC